MSRPRSPSILYCVPHSLRLHMDAVTLQNTVWVQELEGGPGAGEAAGGCSEHVPGASATFWRTTSSRQPRANVQPCHVPGVHRHWPASAAAPGARQQRPWGLHYCCLSKVSCCLCSGLLRDDHCQAHSHHLRIYLGSMNLGPLCAFFRLETEGKLRITGGVHWGKQIRQTW